MTKKIYSHCRGCVRYCGLEFEVEDNNILKMSGNQNSLISEGYKCIKGDMSVEQINGGEFRFEQSQKRDADGKQQAIDNDQLMDEVADILQTTIAKHGPRSVALYWGTSSYKKSFSVPMAKQFMGAIGSPKMFSTMTIDQSAHWVVKERMGIFTTGKPFIDNADLMLFCGTNPVVSNSNPDTSTPLVNQRKRFKAFLDRGGKIIVVDPRISDTAKLASLHLRPTPGTDAELFAGMTRLLLEKNLHDADFCQRFNTNIEQLRQTVAPFTPEVVTQRTGITETELNEAVALIGAARRPSIGFGTGTSMSPHPNTAGHIIEALNALVGGFNRAGDALVNPGLFFKKPAQERVIPAKRKYEREPKLRSGHGMLYGEFPTSRLVDDILNDGDDQIKVLFVLGANPMMTFGQPDKFKAAAEKLDSLIVLDPRRTETTELADYVVAPPVQYEVPDFNLAILPIMHDAPVVQYSDPVVSPPPATMTEWKFFNGIANRLGHVLTSSKSGFASSSHRGGMALTTDRAWTTEDLIESTLAEEGLSIAQLRKHPDGLAVDIKPTEFTAAGQDDDARLDLCPDDVAAEMAAIYNDYKPPSRAYKLVCRRVVELMNTEFRNNARIEKRFNSGYAPLYMHPDDLAREGFHSGQEVSITGEHGAIIAVIKPDASMKLGVVAMPHGLGKKSTVKNNAGKKSSGKKTKESGDHASHNHVAHNHVSMLVSMELEDVAIIDAMPQQSSIPVDIVALSETA